MAYQSIRINYFSGTGTTALAAEAFEAAFRAQGAAVTVQEIRRAGETADGGEDLLLLMFPVHAWNAPKPVYEWIKQLPKAEKKDAAVIAVSAGGEAGINSACRRSSIRRLANRGYRAVYEGMIVMPSNYGSPSPHNDTVRLLRVLPHKADKMAGEILSGKQRHPKPGLSARIVSRLMEIEKFGARVFGNGLGATAECNGCGWCARECPGANIRMADEQPAFGRQCVMCMRCIYGCPQSAIEAKRMGGVVIADGFSVQSMRQQAETAEVGSEPDEQTWDGVRQYLKE